MVVDGPTADGAVCVSVAELAGVLSLATDIALGYSYEHGLRRAVLAVGLAEAVGANAAMVEETYFVSQLMYIGCTAEVSVFAGLFGDELAFGEAVAPHVWGSPRELMRAGTPFIGSGHSGLRRVGAVARALPVMKEQMELGGAGHCEVAQMLAGRLALPGDYTAAFGAAFERWDGTGHPRALRGDEIPLSVRIAQVADDADLQLATHGDVAACARTITARGGGTFDPHVARAFADSAESLIGRLADGSSWAAAIGGKPPTREPLTGRELATALEAVADFADLKGPCFLGRSRAVAELAAAAAAAQSLDSAEVRCAGLVKDVGRVGVPTIIWERTMPLQRDDWERIRLHPYQTERIVGSAPGLAEIARLASFHHERLDGSGYHRGASAAAIPPSARVLAAADVYIAMTASRPYRPALTEVAAAAGLRAEVASSRLDGDAVEAVLAAAGQPAEDSSRPKLTGRELDVLHLLAQGKLTKQVAHELGIARKTADNHIQSIYAKTGVSTRAGATLFAIEHGLLRANSL
jgi:HD-GYP domain-containing protein (c-di-GMP phosphodiesterase class II)